MSMRVVFLETYCSIEHSELSTPLFQTGAERRPFELAVLGVFDSLLGSTNPEIKSYLVKIDFLLILLNSIKARPVQIRTLGLFILDQMMACETACADLV
jgi:hypothetical protein